MSKPSLYTLDSAKKANSSSHKALADSHATMATNDLASFATHLPKLDHQGTSITYSESWALVTSSRTSASMPKQTTASKQVIAVEAGDDCYSISRDYNVSTSHLLNHNGLEPHCQNFPKQGQLTLPESCEIYEIQKGDTCEKIVSAYHLKITRADLMSWNPSIKDDCSNLPEMERSWICLRLVMYPKSLPYACADRIYVL